MDEQKLLRRIRKGDTAALDAVIGRYAPYVNAIVSNILRAQLGREDAEELVSDVFLSLWNHRETLRPVSLRGWLAQTARNAARNRLRSLHLSVPLDDEVLQLRDEAAGLEPAILQRELEQAVREAMEQLSTQDREIFRRYYYFYQKTGEIAAALGMNESTVTTRLQRGRRKLRACLTERGYCDG